MPETTVIVGVAFLDDGFRLSLSDGMHLHVPYACSKKLATATEVQRANVRIDSGGLHWDEFDEDLELLGLIRDQGRATR
jgi:hypothetical protein